MNYLFLILAQANTETSNTEPEAGTGYFYLISLVIFLFLAFYSLWKLRGYSSYVKRSIDYMNAVEQKNKRLLELLEEINKKLK